MANEFSVEIEIRVFSFVCICTLRCGERLVAYCQAILQHVTCFLVDLFDAIKNNRDMIRRRESDKAECKKGTKKANRVRDLRFRCCARDPFRIGKIVAFIDCLRSEFY